jgi:3-oxoacyl-[acyl-carrier protein] reductase
MRALNARRKNGHMTIQVFKDRVAVVTGGAIGIGEASLRQFVKQGAKAVIVDTNEERAKSIVRDLPQGSVVFAKTDVSNEQQVSAAIKTAIDAFGRIDILLNSAGITSLVGPVLVENIELAEWNRMLNINLTGTFLMIKHATPHMKRQGYGRIVNISSTAALGAGYKGAAPYAATKAGVVGLMRMIAREGGGFGITCNAIAPGPTKTPTRKVLIEKEQELIRTVPVGFLAEADDIAYPVTWLCSEQARFITGQLLFVDGGVSIPWHIDEILSPTNK